MAERNRDIQLSVRIDAGGQPVVDGDTAAHLTREGCGTWKLVPELGRLMLLERIGDAPAQRVDREVIMAGVCRGLGKLASILNLIHIDRLDGALHVNAKEHQRVLYFRGGVFLAGRSTAPEDKLGRVLVRAGLLTPEQRKEAIAHLSEGQRLGTIVVARKMLTTPQVYEGLRHQSEHILFSTLASPLCTYYLVSPLDMQEVPAMLRLDVEHLLLEGMRQIDEGKAGVSAPVALDEEDEPELSRTRPVPIDQLPADGLTRIISVYNDALRTLFGAVSEKTRAGLFAELRRFVSEAHQYSDLFAGLEVASDGTLPRQGLVANLRTVSDASMTMLQLGLNELLFFVMFAAGDALEPEVERRLQQQVAVALRALPTPE